MRDPSLRWDDKQNLLPQNLSFPRRWESINTIMLKPEHQYAVYILSNKKNGTLYIGMTNNLERRIFEHKHKLVEGFTKKYNIHKLVYFEVYQYVNDAILREKRLKSWNRQWKINLIEEANSDWNDLALDWFD